MGVQLDHLSLVLPGPVAAGVVYALLARLRRRRWRNEELHR
jgi:hypothetical protein